MRILVLRGGALGDFIVTLPALRAIRGRWPSAYVALVGNARAAELAVSTGDLDMAYSQHEARWAKLFSLEPLPTDLAEWFDQFDLILNYWPDPSGAINQHFAHRQSTYISHPSSAIRTRPAAQHFLEPLQRLGLATDVCSVQLRMPDAAVVAARERLRGLKDFIAIHPGSGSTAKNWPADRWLELIPKFQQPILLILGEAERHGAHVPESAQLVQAREWPLPVLAAALSHSAVFIGHDSGISHLAAATGANCLLLFGPTDHEIWAPVGVNSDQGKSSVSKEKIHVLHPNDKTEDISVADVWTAAAKLGAV